MNAVGLSAEEFLTLHRLHRRPPPRGRAASPRSTAGVNNPLPWLAEMMDIKKEQNFFEGRVTEYQKASSLNVAARRRALSSRCRDHANRSN